MAETKERNTKKLVAIIVAAVLVVALVVTGVVLVLKKNNSADGPFDANGEPLYPKTSDIVDIEYLHRGGINSSTGVTIDEKELSDKDDIAAFMDELKAVELRDPTEEERTSVDYTADVDMFTINTKDDTETTVLIMGDSLSVGPNFYMTEGLNLKTLTKNFGDMDYSDKLVSGSDEDGTEAADAAELATAAQ